MKHENNEKYFQTQSALTDRNEKGETGTGTEKRKGMGMGSLDCLCGSAHLIKRDIQLLV